MANGGKATFTNGATSNWPFGLSLTAKLTGGDWNTPSTWSPEFVPTANDDVTINSEELIVPHPRFAERRFVLEPLSEVAPEHCPSQWRNRLPSYGVYPRGPIDGLVAHVSL